MPGWETLAVAAIVGGAVAWAARGVVRAVRARRVCSDCASSGGCPLASGEVSVPPGSTCRTDPQLSQIGGDK